jgi:poly(A) polymerase
MTEDRASANDRPSCAALLDAAHVKRIFETFVGAGEDTRIVGGAVRNAVLGAPVHEIDFATTAVPREIIRRAAAAGLRSVPTGIEHGTVTVIVEGVPFEMTTLREDVETDGRRARVRFGRSFEHDALRRDFTVNALSLDAQGRIHDYTDGLADIAARKVRFIGVARQRIREDYLRILRYFRFHAAYGRGPMDAEAFHAIVAERDGLALLSRERVRAELMKLLVTPGAAAVTSIMSDAGLLQPILGGIAWPRRLERLAAIDAAEQPDAELRWIAAFVQVREDAERLRDRLRLSNAETQRALDAAGALEPLHGLQVPPDPAELRRMLFERGRQAALDAVVLAQAQVPAPANDAAWAHARAFLRDTPVPVLPFNGSDLMARGVPAGRAIGQALKSLQARWIRAGFPKDPAVLARLLQDALERPN